MEKKISILALVLVVTATSTLFAMAKPVKEKTPKDENIVGVYNLIKVNGSKLPATISHGNVQRKVYSGTFTINADRTCISKIIFGPPSGEKNTRKVEATYTKKGSTLKMKWKGAGWTKGTIKGDAFKMNNEGMIFAYKKQPAPSDADSKNTKE